MPERRGKDNSSQDERTIEDVLNEAERKAMRGGTAARLYNIDI